PLDPVIVLLRDLKGNDVASAVTDIDGRYGFFVKPGKYQLLAKKTNYFFPSLKLNEKKDDEIYTNLYFGETIEITKPGQIIDKNIPLDPIDFDWNEFAKRG